nr:metallophosphoesterase family protein [Fodinicola feengrottensis]
MPEASKQTVTRRGALGLLGAVGTGAAAAPLLGATPASASPAFVPSVGNGATPVQGLHLTFGANPARQMVASWITEGSVRRPRVVYGTLDGGFGCVAQADTRTYVDGTSGRTVWIHHAELDRLRPGTDYIYAVQHDGATPDAGTFRTAPAGRAPFTFTSFGDQSAPQVTWLANGTAGLDANSTPATKDIVTGIETVAPLFHLLNGDLCYANLDVDRVRTWNNFFTNNTRSARFRPWMPAAGNHEIEKANGPIGLDAFQAYFKVPSTETDAELAGLWYAFTVGSVRVIVLQNDDNCLQDGGDVYISGYSGGRQLGWLRRELAAARSSSRDIDWVVVAMHQVMISTSDANGADLGLRQKYGPLFDQYGVDLVLCGHEHDYERSLAVRGVVAGSETLTPRIRCPRPPT